MPKKFRFRLQPVLDQRERLEQDAQQKVAALEAERLTHEQGLRDIQRELLASREMLRTQLQRPGDGASLAGVRLQSNAILHVTIKAQRKAIELAGALKRLEEARKELIAASAARKAVQMLKDKAIAEHRSAVQKQEAAELDEMMVMRHGRHGAGAAGGLLLEDVPPHGADES